jgi:hypothetical protein
LSNNKIVNRMNRDLDNFNEYAKTLPTVVRTGIIPTAKSGRGRRGKKRISFLDFMSFKKRIFTSGILQSKKHKYRVISELDRVVAQTMEYYKCSPIEEQRDQWRKAVLLNAIGIPTPLDLYHFNSLVNPKADQERWMPYEEAVARENFIRSRFYLSPYPPARIFPPFSIQKYFPNK